MKFIYIIISFLLISFTHPQAPHPVTCAPKLHPTYQTLCQLPEVEELIETVLKEGPIHIQVNRHLPKTFEGYWDHDNRSIYLTETRSTTDAGRISTLLFELHNALRSDQIIALENQAATGAISKKDFVRSIEQVEYYNALDTSKLLDKGIELGLFPPSCHWPLSPTFEEHFRIQKRYGHSGFLANNYDELRYVS